MTTRISTKPAHPEAATATEVAPGTQPSATMARESGDPTTPSARYEVTGKLGSGGLGVVLEALDLETRRVVAIKLPRRGSDEASTDAVLAPEESATRTDPMLDRFAVEARVTAQLEHPAIVPVYDVGRSADGTPYYTMRVVGRRSLRDVLVNPELRATFTTTRLVSVLVQVARARTAGSLRDSERPGSGPGTS